MKTNPPNTLTWAEREKRRKQLTAERHVRDPRAREHEWTRLLEDEHRRCVSWSRQYRSERWWAERYSDEGEVQAAWAMLEHSIEVGRFAVEQWRKFRALKRKRP